MIKVPLYFDNDILFSAKFFHKVFMLFSYGRFTSSKLSLRSGGLFSPNYMWKKLLTDLPVICFHQIFPCMVKIFLFTHALLIHSFFALRFLE